MSATEGASFSSKVGNAFQSAWQGIRHVTTEHVVPGLKYTAEKISLAWEKAFPVIQEVLTTQSSLGGCFVVLSLCTLPLALIVAQKNLKVAFCIMGLGIILGAVGMLLLSSSGALPVFALLS